MSWSTRPFFWSGCAWMAPRGGMRGGGWPAVMQAVISSVGEPSDVRELLKSFIATSLLEVGGRWCQVPLEIIPEAPSPRRWWVVREDQGISFRVGLSAGEGEHGLPAKERNESSGSSKSQLGRVVRLLEDSRMRPSFRQCAISSGKLSRRFP